MRSLLGKWLAGMVGTYGQRGDDFWSRGFPCRRVVSGESGRSLGERIRPTQAMLPVPGPCAGRSPETEMIAADARLCAAPRGSPGHPVSGSVPALSRLAPLRNRLLRQTVAVPASTHRLRPSSVRGTG